MNASDTNNAGNPSNPAESQFLQMMAHASGESAASGPPALSSTPTMSGLLQALRRRWLTAVGVGVVATALAILAVFQLMPPKYVVVARVQIVAVRQADDVEFPLYKASMESLIKSPRVIKAALREKLADGREVCDFDIVRSKGGNAVDWLEKSLKTDFLLGPEILKVTFAADNPDEAADLLNAIVRSFMSECAEMDRAKRQQRVADLRVKKDRIEEDLRLLRNNLAAKRTELKINDHDAANAINQQWMQKLATVETLKRTNDEEIAKAQAELIDLQAKLANVNNYKVSQEFLDEWLARDKAIAVFQAKLVKIDADIDYLRAAKVGPGLFAELQPLRREKIDINMKIKEREADLLPDIERKYRAKVREEIEFQLSIAKTKQDSFKLRGEALFKEKQGLDIKVAETSNLIKNKPAPIATLEEKIEVARLSLNQAAQKIGEEEMISPGSRVRVIYMASPPSDRDISRQSKVAGAGGVGIFCLMLFGVAMLEFRSRKIGMVEDVSHGLGMKVIGSVPTAPTGKDAAHDPRWQNQLNESIDAIRTVLLHDARSENLRVLMVSSANSGEGKTTLATQLAASLARAWKRTLIIDGDLRHPGVHQLFDVPQEPGFAEVVRGEVEVSDAVRATPLSRLWVMPAGNGDSHAIQALAQDNVGTIFSALKEQYDFIIIDTPPVLPVTDTLLLGGHADGVVMAILRDVSRAPAVHAAQQKLAPLNVPMLGAVMLGTDLEYTDKNYRYATAK